MLYLGNVSLGYVLVYMYNLEVSFNFHLTFLQLNVIKMFTVQLFSSLFPAIFFKLRITWTLDGSSFFRFPLKVPVIGSQLYMNTNKKLALWQHCPFCIGEWLTWPIIHQPEDAR